MSRNSKLILSKNIKLDKQYKEVLNYTELEMLDLLNSDDHLINRDDKMSFLRENTNVISTGFTYAECLQANYIAFTNPDYSNKWFFAFVDDVIYVSDKVTEIHFTIDVMSTWFNKVSVEQCFVVREHTMDDTMGNNTQPENLELGEYCINGYEDLNGIDFDIYDICIGVSSTPTGLSLSTANLTSRIYNGIYSGLRYFIFDEESSASKFIRGYDNNGMAEAIYTIFIVPKAMITIVTCTFYDNISITSIHGDVTGIRIGVYQPTNDPVFIGSFTDVDQPTDLNGYTPKNNKLYTYPYSYMYITNNCGSDVIYKWEDFDGKPNFGCDGAIGVGCSIKLYPKNYKKFAYPLTYPRACYSYGISAGKYPTCSWNSDSFTNWITENAINIGVGAIGLGVNIATGNVAGATTTIANSVNQAYQHSLVPDQSKGNTNTGDVTASAGQIRFVMQKMCIKYEYARIIDEYFTRFGYKTNLTKVPNINGRTYFNYIQIADSEVIGYGEVPNKYMDEINNIFRKGVTIWHDHTNIGDYTVTNSIVTP